MAFDPLGSIVSMGFAPDQAHAALRIANDDHELALHMLLEGDPR